MLIESINPKNCLDLANIHNNLAGILKENGSYRRAIQHYEISEKLYLKSVQHNHLFLSPTYINLGNIYRLKGKHNEALKYHLKALQIREKTLDENDLQIAEALLEVALTYHELDLNISSIPLLERTKNIYLNNQIPTNHPKFIQLQEALDVCR